MTEVNTSSFIGYIYDRSDRAGAILTAIVILLVYGLSWTILAGFIYADGLNEASINIIAVTGLLFGVALFITTVVMHFALKWRVHTISLGLTATLAHFFAIGMASDIVYLLFRLGDIDPPNTMLMILALFLSQVIFMGFFWWMKRFESERFALPKMIENIVGVTMILLILRMAYPDVFFPQLLDNIDKNYYATYLISGTPTVLAIATLASIWKGSFWNSVYVWFAAFMVCQLLGANEDFVAQLRHEYIILAPLFMIAFVALLRFIIVPAIWFLWNPERRSGAAEELSGSLFMPLSPRSQYWGRDLAAFVLAAIGYGAEMLQRSILLPLTTENFDEYVQLSYVIGFCFSFLLLVAFSTLMRMWRHKRMRIGVIIAVIIVTTIVSSFAYVLINLAFEAIINKYDYSIYDNQFLTTAIFTIVNYSILFAVLAFFYRVPLNANLVAFVVKCLIGGALAQYIIINIAGPTTAEAFLDPVKINDTRLTGYTSIRDIALAVILSLTFVFYIFHRDQKLGILIWPVVAFIASIMLNLFYASQTQLQAVDARISTGWSEIFISASVGVFFGYVYILAKRIWYDQDPVARRDAVRLRGAGLIIYAVWPFIMMLFVFGALQGFKADVQDETRELRFVMNEFQQQGRRLGQHYSGEVKRLQQSLKTIQTTLDTAIQDAIKKGEEIPEKLKKIAADAKDAAERAGAKTASKAAAAGKKALGRGLSNVGEGVGEAVEEVGGFAGKILRKIADLFPDLNIGSIFSDAFAWDSGFQAIFDEFKSSAFAAITEEFAGPRQDLQDIYDDITGDIGTVSTTVQNEINSVKMITEDAIERAKFEYARAAANAEYAMVQMTSFIKHLMLLCIYLTIILIGLLLWRAIAGLSVMYERISEGWNMLIYGTEAQRA